MNERERCDEWINRRYKTGLSECEEAIAIESWQARAEIAKQDEKELIEALIEIQKAQYQPSGPLSGLNTAIKLSRAIIEKHTGKTWEELNG